MDQAISVKIDYMTSPEDHNGQRRDLAASLWHFIFYTKENRQLLSIALVGTAIQFILFKCLYPFPDFFSDSYSYIYAASEHMNISIWPIGYSKFLSIFHAITHSDTAVIAFQYFLLEAAALYFLFTFLYIYNPGRLGKILLFAFLFFNPLFLYLSNYINSDALFAALSLFWFTQLLWIVHKPSTYQIFLHAALLFLCFTVRNNAYYYPFIALVAFLLSKQILWRKILGLGLPALLILSFIIYTKKEAKKLTGVEQFSLFTGWQLANNALYMYDKIQVDSTIFKTAGSKELDRITKQYFRSIPANFPYQHTVNTNPGNFYIQFSKSPLKIYLWEHYALSDERSKTIAWGKASSIFAGYGVDLIKSHPIAYAKYFMLLNAKNYFLPHMEKLSLYNLGTDDVPAGVQNWFDYKTPDVWAISKTAQAYILYLMPTLFLFLNLLFIARLSLFMTKRRYLIADNNNRSRLIILTSVFLLANFSFTVFATIDVLRYQVFPMIICFTGVLALAEMVKQKDKSSRFNGQLINNNHDRVTRESGPLNVAIGK